MRMNKIKHKNSEVICFLLGEIKIKNNGERNEFGTLIATQVSSLKGVSNYYIFGPSFNKFKLIYLS